MLEAMLPTIKPLLVDKLRSATDDELDAMATTLVEIDAWAMRRLAFAVLKRTVVAIGHFEPRRFQAWAQLPDDDPRRPDHQNEGWLNVDQALPPI